MYEYLIIYISPVTQNGRVEIVHPVAYAKKSYETEVEFLNIFGKDHWALAHKDSCKYYFKRKVKS